MIREKLRKKELEIQQKITNELEHFNTIRKIQDLFGQIDHSTELIPDKNMEKLIDLLKSLKGSDLNEEELRILSEI